MLIIRPEQMQVLDEAMQRSFELRMVQHLRATFPELTQKHADERLLNFIQRGIKSAAQYDVVIEYDVLRYIECMVTYGPQFDKNPETDWATQILNNSEINGTRKMNQIKDYEQSLTNRH